MEKSSDRANDCLRLQTLVRDLIVVETAHTAEYGHGSEPAAAAVV